MEETTLQPLGGGGVWQAIESGDVDALRPHLEPYLLAMDLAGVLASSRVPSAYLTRALSLGTYATVKTLLDYGARPTPATVRAAVRRGDPALLRLLLRPTFDRPAELVAALATDRVAMRLATSRTQDTEGGPGGGELALILRQTAALAAPEEQGEDELEPQELEQSPPRYGRKRPLVSTGEGGLTCLLDRKGGRSSKVRPPPPARVGSEDLEATLSSHHVVGRAHTLL
jgi:hypothetical protein